MLLTPELDLTGSGDSFEVNRLVDVNLSGSLADSIALYAGDHDLSHPYLSPLFGDFKRWFPPTFLQAGTRDLFLSNAVHMHRVLRAGPTSRSNYTFSRACRVAAFKTHRKTPSLQRKSIGSSPSIGDE